MSEEGFISASGPREEIVLRGAMSGTKINRRTWCGDIITKAAFTSTRSDVAGFPKTSWTMVTLMSAQEEKGRLRVARHSHWGIVAISRLAHGEKRLDQAPRAVSRLVICLAGNTPRACLQIVCPPMRHGAANRIGEEQSRTMAVKELLCPCKFHKNVAPLSNPVGSRNVDQALDPKT